MRFNAMEVINSGATQSEPLQLLHDWMGLLNAGRRVTPIGSSDSHDVNRFIVGQGRTYIRCDDNDPANIDIAAAARSLVEGHVQVSYGLLVELQLEGRFGSGDLARLDADEDELHASVRVLGPEWVTPRRLLLYANGKVVREEALKATEAGQPRPGIWYEAEWSLDRPTHDVYLTAVVVGDGITEAFWRTAKPYQPISPSWEPNTLGCSGAVYVDSDADGRWSSARDYAQRIMQRSNGDARQIARQLAGYDAAVASQSAHFFRAAAGDLDELEEAVRESGASLPLQGVRDYQEAWRLNELAQFE
jgi:hypothetical protein